MKNNKANIFEFSPVNIGEKIFRIPIYQRLYSWGKPQIEQLLQDLLACFEKDKTKDYFIGNLILAQNKSSDCYDLIDGQQRLTTLWLMGFVFKKYLKSWEKFIGVPGHLRVSFSARDNINQYLNDLISTKESILLTNENSTLVNAIKYINVFLEDTNINKNEFALYIFNHIKLIGVVLPDQTDLNKYFEIMNNRGVQLEKHEILKARLLEKIDKEEQEKYGIVWNACSQMNKYIEDSFSGEQRIKLSNIVNKPGEINPSNIIKIIKDENRKESKSTLYDILYSMEGLHNSSEVKEIKKNDLFKDETVDKYSSICNFPDFLLHVFKIFSKNYEDIKINNKDLLDFIKIENYSESITDELFSKRFIESLLKFRILFDKYMIKGSSINTTEYKWQIKTLVIKNDGINFFREHDLNSINVERIQSMLNFSTQPEHWLTPTLNYISNNYNLETFNNNSFIDWLELLDHKLALERLTDTPKLLKTSNEILKNFDSVKIFNNSFNNLWNKNLHTERYWYFKLDYCLLKKYNDDQIKDEKIDKFRFKANNSVEHVHAQSERNENEKWDYNILNSFGNLALISVNANSEYNDQPFKNKKIDFESRSKKYGYESLKLREIYNDYNEWNETACKEHEVKMTSILNDYHRAYSG